jgi:glycosyltransferase involved in cell wall biosynthesis
MVKKSILIISSFAYPHTGGVELFTYQIAKRFLLNGCDVTLICLNTEKTLKKEKIEGINYYRLPCFNIINDRLPFPKINREFFNLAKEVLNINFDFVILNVKFYLLTLLGAWFSKIKNLPVILIEHGSGHFDLNFKLLSLLGQLYEHSITYFVKITKVKFYGVSEAVNQWLLHFGILASGVIYNGVDSHYQPETSISFKRTYKLPDEAVIVSYIGRLVEEKGVLQLKDAIQELLVDYPNLYFMVAGDGPLKSTFVNLPERIFYIGNIEHDHVFRLLQETNIFVLPTRMKEGLPTVILEAGIQGCTVIATPSGGIKEVIVSRSQKLYQT